MSTANPESTKSEAATPESARARYIMIGGFLGAGKTTAVARLARHLADRGLRVGLITNDQGSELVDTAMLRSRGFATEEISGGCFCCRFNSLLDAAKRLSAATRPDVFIAEPVGSCTDLVATVSYPLRRIYGDEFAIAPLSVLVDPVRAARVLGLGNGAKFSDKVRYIYRKQLEEADLIVINKIDLLDSERHERLRHALAEEFPQTGLLEISARDGTGLEPWFLRLTAGEQSMRPAMEVDYELYAEGEALLGWLNATIELCGAAPFDGNKLVERFAGEIHRRLIASGNEVAHLKITLDPHNGFGELAIINLVRNDWVAEMSQRLEEPIERAGMIVNLRAEASPEVLRAAVEGALAEKSGLLDDVTARVEHLEFFKPGKPQPTHRVASP